MPPRSRFTHSKTLLALLLLDAVATMLVFNVVAHFRGVTGHAVVAPLLGPLAALVFAIYLIDGYRVRTDMMSLDYTSLHLIAGGAAMLTILLLTFVVLPHGYELQSSRSVIVLSFLILIPLTLSYRRLQHQRRLAFIGGRSLIFLGDREGCEAFREECNTMGTWQPVIHCPIHPPADGKADVLSQPFAEALAAMQEGSLAVDAIVMRDIARQLQPELAQQLVQLHFQGIPTLTLKQFYQLNWQKVPVAGLDPMWLFQDGFQIAREPVFERLKRASDVFLSALGLLVAAPVIAVAGLAILAGDGRPVIFRQKRIGLNRQPFSLLKLRTMKVGSRGDDLYTLPGDARITPVGRLLRTTRIDELPQLWNVLRGDMSLIGPRAEWDLLVERYEREIPCYHFRHLVKPGITGWAQVNYPYGSNLDDTIRKLEYDLYYIQNFSFTLDASIFLKTIHVMILGRGR